MQHTFFSPPTETGAEPSLQATQMKLKRARLADNLNEKIAQRPGPMELIEKNILPVDSSLKQAIIGEGAGNVDDDDDAHDRCMSGQFNAHRWRW